MSWGPHPRKLRLTVSQRCRLRAFGVRADEAPVTVTRVELRHPRDSRPRRGPAGGGKFGLPGPNIHRMKRPRGRPPHADVLTPAEWRTVHAVQHGLKNAEIARRRGVSVEAIKFHISNALAKLGLKNRRELRAWFRAPHGSAISLVKGKEGTRVTGTDITGLGQVARTVSDAAAAERWYRDVLGLRHLYTYGTLAFFDLGGTRLMLSQAEGGAAKESILYLRVADIAAAHSELIARGVTFTHAPHLIHKHPNGLEEWMAFFEDPDGRPLALMSQVGGAG
jgi:DNA-binding CsgD family transcriptional regulator/catechol 2,3-dioxygenase-like lactoylglutathione lyase family enzyme